MNLVEQLKKDFEGSRDYLSGINDGMYHLLRHIDKLNVEKVKTLTIPCVGVSVCPNCKHPRPKNYEGEGSCENCSH